MRIFGFEIKRESTSPAPTLDTSGVKGANWQERLLGSSTPDVAAKVSAVYHCVDIISNAIALMPLRYKRLDKETGVMRDAIKWDKDRLNYLLNVRPNSRMNAFDFKKGIIMHKLTCGNAFVLAVDDNGKALPNFEDYVIDHLVLINPANVDYDIRTDTYRLSDLEQDVPLQQVSSAQIFHIKNTNFGDNSGFWGESTLHYALSSIRMAATGDGEMLKRVANGGRNKCILGYDNADTPFGVHSSEQMKAAADDLVVAASSKDIFPMPYKGLTLIPFSMNSTDLKLLETAQLSRADIADFFHLPHYYLGMSTSNYKTPDAAYTYFINNCLSPHCVQCETEFLSKYATTKDWWTMQFDFDEEARNKLDVESQSNKDAADLAAGLVTINELRAKHGKMPVKGGDEILVSANMKTAAMLQKEGAAPAQSVTPKGKDEDEQ